MSVLLDFFRRQEDGGDARQFIITRQSLQRLVNVRPIFFKLSVEIDIIGFNQS
jgi:hypothetical protein